MIVTETTTPGTYTIDETVGNKTTYNLTTSLSIDGTVVSTVLPYTYVASKGVHELILTMTNISSSYTSKYCLFYDTTLYCQVVTKLAEMKEDEKLKSNLPYNYYLLKESGDSTNCFCQCQALKDLYTEINNDLTDNCC